MMKKYKFFVILLLLFFVVLVSLLSLGIGPKGISFSFLEGIERVILIEVRLPRLFLGLLCGAVLAISGSAFQGVLRNPLADPYILGVSSGAAFGISLALFLRVEKIIYLGSFGISIFSFCGALLTIFFVYRLSKIGGKLPSDTLLLSGVIANTFFASCVMAIMVFGKKELKDIIYLLFGNLGVVWSKEFFVIFLVSAILSLVCSFWIFLNFRAMNALTLGEEVAETLGIDVEGLKKKIFIFSSISVASVVTLCGSIGFVGLIVPHIVRMGLSSDYRFLFPGSFLLGGGLLVISDALARSIFPLEVPVGIVTSLFGVPFFVYLLEKRKREI